MKRIRDCLNRISVAKRSMRTQPVLTQAADALLEALLGVRAILGIVRCPAVQWGAEDGRDDEHVRSSPACFRTSRRAPDFRRPGVRRKNPLMRRDWLVSHHSSFVVGTCDIAATAPAVHRPEH